MKAFQRVPKSLSTSINGELPTEGELLSNIGNIQVFVLDLTMDIKEDDGKVIDHLIFTSSSTFDIVIYFNIRS